jgi:hypothetical protein
MRTRDRAADSTPRNAQAIDPLERFLLLDGSALPTSLLVAMTVTLLLS